MSCFLFRFPWLNASVYRSQNARLATEQSVAVVDATSWNIRSNSMFLDFLFIEFLTGVRGTSRL